MFPATWIRKKYFVLQITTVCRFCFLASHRRDMILILVFGRTRFVQSGDEESQGPGVEFAVFCVSDQTTYDSAEAHQAYQTQCSKIAKFVAHFICSQRDTNSSIWRELSGNHALAEKIRLCQFLVWLFSDECFEKYVEALQLFSIVCGWQRS